jgi:hypothetical protein
MSLMSLMVEAGKTNEVVRERLEQFFQQQTHQLTLLLEEGKSRGEIRGALPAKALASLITSWLEGTLMLASIAPIFAAAAMALSPVTVVSNSLRLRWSGR